jgi:hypothetical protein
MNKLITVYWRDIPAQVIGRKGRKSVCKKMLDPRFQHAIDRAAMRARKISEDAYLEDWRRVSSPCEGDIEQAVNEEALRLETEYTVDFLDTLARAGGKNRTNVESETDQAARAED